MSGSFLPSFPLLEAVFGFISDCASPPWEKQTPIAVYFRHFDGLRIRELSGLNQNDCQVLHCLLFLSQNAIYYIHSLTSSDSNDSIRGLGSHSSLFSLLILLC